MVYFFSVAANDSMRTETLEDGPVGIQSTWALEQVQEAYPCQNFQAWRNFLIYQPGMAHIQNQKLYN